MAPLFFVFFFCNFGGGGGGGEVGWERRGVTYLFIYLFIYLFNLAEIVSILCSFLKTPKK